MRVRVERKGSLLHKYTDGNRLFIKYLLLLFFKSSLRLENLYILSDKLCSS